VTELNAKLDELRAEILELAEIPELSDEQSARYEAANVEFDEIRSQIEAAEARTARIEEIRRFAPVGEVKPETTEASMPESINVNTRTSPFDGEGDLRSRALTAIESHLPRSTPDSTREAMTSLVEKESTRNFNADEAAEIALRTCSPGYLSEFRDYMRNPMNIGPELRAAMSLTAANGGVLVPQLLDPSVILTGTGTANDVRRIARVEQTTVGTWEGVTSAGATAEWLAEGTEAADATPTFVQPTVTAHKAAAWVFGSYEVLADSGFDEIAMVLADAFDVQEETAFATGTGVGQPFGLVTVLSGTGPVVNGTSGAAGAADLVAADAYALDDALGPRWRRNASFLANKAIYNRIRRATDAQDNFWASFGGGLPAEMIGYQVYESNGMEAPSTVVSGSNDHVLLLGDFKQYLVADRIGTTLMYEPFIKGANQRPTGQAGWFAYKRTGANVLTSNAFKLLRI
jgi:HK97 family phage major capsid protein